MHFQTKEAVKEAFTSLQAFLCPGNVDQVTPLCTHGGEESTFLAQCGLSSKNLQDQDEDDSMSLCEACLRITSQHCRKNKQAINCWTHDGFIDILNKNFDRLASLQNSTAIRICVADAMATLRLAEAEQGSGQETI